MSFYNLGLKKLINGEIDLDTSSDIRVMLVKEGYNFNHLIEEVDTGGNDTEDPSYYECDCTGYAGGFSGAGRKTPTISIAGHGTENYVTITINDITWTALGGSVDNDIGGVIFLWKNTSDTDSVPLFCFIFDPVTTTGGDFTLEFEDIVVS